MAVALASIKSALGISADVYNDELTALIASAEADLQLSGVTIYQPTDPLIITAVACYCQANRGTDADKLAKFAELYRAQKRNLWIAAEYTEAAADGA